MHEQCAGTANVRFRLKIPKTRGNGAKNYEFSKYLLASAFFLAKSPEIFVTKRAGQLPVRSRRKNFIQKSKFKLRKLTMKSKLTLLAATLFAASAFAVPAEAEEETVTVDVFSMDAFSLDASETTDTDALAALGVNADSVTAASVTTYLGAAETGVYVGSEEGFDAYIDYGTRVSWSFTGTSTNTDSYLAIVISVEDLLAEAGLDASSVGSLSLTFSSYSTTYSRYSRSFSAGSNANSKNLPADDEDEDVSVSSLVAISDESTESNSDGDALTTWVVSGGEAAAVALATDDDGYTITISDVSEISSVVLLFSLGEGNTSAYGSTTCAVHDITATITVVPEPSVFGMAAGIAALALAVSRRTRRSRKIA